MAIALTNSALSRFRGPSLWGESDCLRWGEMITGVPLAEDSIWRTFDTEISAIRYMMRQHGSYRNAVAAALLDHEFTLLSSSVEWQFGDAVLVMDDRFGDSLCGVGEGYILLLRHPYGIAPAIGSITHIFRRVV